MPLNIDDIHISISWFRKLIHCDNFSTFKSKSFHPIKARGRPIFGYDISIVPQKNPFMSISPLQQDLRQSDNLVFQLKNKLHTFFFTL